MGQGPLKWTEIGPTNDPWVISDEFETSWDNHFWRGQTRTKIFVQNIIHFIKIQNIHSNKIFIFFKIQNIHSNKIFIFLKRAVSHTPTHPAPWKKTFPALPCRMVILVSITYSRPEIGSILDLLERFLNSKVYSLYYGGAMTGQQMFCW